MRAPLLSRGPSRLKDHFAFLGGDPDSGGGHRLRRSYGRKAPIVFVKPEMMYNFTAILAPFCVLTRPPSSTEPEASRKAIYNERPLYSMKTPQTMPFVLLAVTAVLLLGRVGSGEAPRPATTTVIASPTEQYRVIDASQIPIANRQNAPGTLETVLNELGADGWRVRTAMGSSIILAR
jgi:hypothetical protein